MLTISIFVLEISCLRSVLLKWKYIGLVDIIVHCLRSNVLIIMLFNFNLHIFLLIYLLLYIEQTLIFMYYIVFRGLLLFKFVFVILSCLKLFIFFFLIFFFLEFTHVKFESFFPWYLLLIVERNEIVKSWFLLTEHLNILMMNVIHIVCFAFWEIAVLRNCLYKVLASLTFLTLTCFISCPLWVYLL